MAVHEVPSPGVSDARPPRHTRFEPLAVPKDDDSDIDTQAVPAKDEAELELLADDEFPLKSVVAMVARRGAGLVRSASVGPSTPPQWLEVGDHANA